MLLRIYLPGWATLSRNYCKYRSHNHQHIPASICTQWRKHLGLFSVFQIDPFQSQSGVLTIPYLLPCVCVQVLWALYYYVFSTGNNIINYSWCCHSCTHLIFIYRYITPTAMPGDVRSVLFWRKESQASVKGRIMSKSNWKQIHHSETFQFKGNNLSYCHCFVIDVEFDFDILCYDSHMQNRGVPFNLFNDIMMKPEDKAPSQRITSFL